MISNKKKWPTDCVWPEPSDYGMDYDEDLVNYGTDDETDELLEIKEYYDSLVDSRRLNEDYSLNKDYEEWHDDDEENEDEFIPEKGEEYWRDGFDIESWREDLSRHINLLEIAPRNPEKNPIIAMRSAFSYDFTNENLLRQAFTRRSFQIEYGLDGCSEELEFLGDTILSTVVTKEIMKQFSKTDIETFEAPFQSKYDEGELTKIRQHFISKESLAARARELGLGKYILYGTGEKETDSSLEDMMEALIGAVVMDCSWDMYTIEKFVNELICVQLDTPDAFLKKSYYDVLNAWHQKHFGRIPTYKISANPRKEDDYECEIKFYIPKNNKGVHTTQIFYKKGATRSKARENAARNAYDFIYSKGLLKNLGEAGITPDFENSINQLQELFQKGYLDEKPEYEYDDRGNEWHVSCRVEGYDGWGVAKSKVKAKKKAAYMVIVGMLISAGICNDEWRKICTTA